MRYQGKAPARGKTRGEFDGAQVSANGRMPNTTTCAPSSAKNNKPKRLDHATASDPRKTIPGSRKVMRSTVGCAPRYDRTGTISSGKGIGPPCPTPMMDGA